MNPTESPTESTAPSAPAPAATPGSSQSGFRLVAAGLGVLIALVLLEVGLRTADVAPDRYPPPRWEAWDGRAFVPTESWGGGIFKRQSRLTNQGVRMGEYVPGARFRSIYGSNPRGYFDDDGGLTYEINSLGLRGPDVAEQTPVNTVRVLGIGDSFAFGQGVRDEDTFLRRLESDLNDRAPPGWKAEVLNAGVQGYNTRDEVLHLQHQWMRLDPDLVLLTFYLNDAYSDGEFKNMGEGTGAYLAQPEGIAKWCRTADLIQHWWRSRQVRAEMTEYYRRSYFAQGPSAGSPDPGREFDWVRGKGAFGHAAKLCREQGAEFAVVIFPEMYALDGDYPFESIHSLVREECERLDVPVLDLLETFRGQDAESLWVHPTDQHPNEIAHALAADAIAAFVAQRKLPWPE